MSARNGTSWSGRCEVLTYKELPMGSYAGVDWAADKHDVLVADEAGEELLAATFAHDDAGPGSERFDVGGRFVTLAETSAINKSARFVRLARVAKASAMVS